MPERATRIIHTLAESIFSCKKIAAALLLCVQGMVKELTATEAKLSNGEVLPFGVCVWSTGVGPTSFTNSLPFAKTAKGRLAVDKFLRVLGKSDNEDQKTREVCNTPDPSTTGALDFWSFDKSAARALPLLPRFDSWRLQTAQLWKQPRWKVWLALFQPGWGFPMSDTSTCKRCMSHSRNLQRGPKCK